MTQFETTRRGGFSLIELILVVTLIAIISSVVVPIYSNSLKTVNADYAQRDIIALLKYAQERAITDTTHYRFYVDETKRQYWLMRLETTDDGERLFVEVMEKQARRRTWSEQVEIEVIKAFEDRDLDASFLEFYPSGACDYGEFLLKRDDGTEIEIEVAGRVGQIEVKE